MRMYGWQPAGAELGRNWGNLRSIGEKVGMNGKTSGIIRSYGLWTH